MTDAENVYLWSVGVPSPACGWRGLLVLLIAITGCDWRYFFMPWPRPISVKHNSSGVVGKISPYCVIVISDMTFVVLMTFWFLSAQVSHSPRTSCLWQRPYWSVCSGCTPTSTTSTLTLLCSYRKKHISTHHLNISFSLYRWEPDVAIRTSWLVLCRYCIHVNIAAGWIVFIGLCLVLQPGIWTLVH